MPKETRAKPENYNSKRSRFGAIVRAKRKLFDGEVRIGRHKLPKAVIAGILSVILLYIAVAGMVSVTAPWLVRGDTRQHIDYIWRISHGQIPRWNDGLTYPPFVKLYGYKHEAAAANPPLFYIIHAPVVGPLLNRYKVGAAIAVGRILNLIIGIGCILALAWAGWLYGGRRAALFSVAVPAISVMIYRFLRLNVDYALDVLLVLFATLAMVNAYKLVKVGPKLKYIIWAAVLSVLGMATKASYLVPLSINLLAILASAYLWSTRKLRYKALAKSVLIAIGILLLVAVTIGWFYYNWNYKSSGKFISAAPANYLGGRKSQTLFGALTSHDIWALFYSSYTTVGFSIAITSFTLAAYLRISKDRYMAYIKDKKTVVLIALLILTVLGTWGSQVVLAAGSGSINFRYMLPALLPFGLYLAYGLLEYKILKGQLVTAVSVIMGLETLVALGLLHRTTIYSAVLVNHLPLIVPKLLILLFILGACLLSLSMYSLSNSYRES